MKRSNLAIFAATIIGASIAGHAQADQWARAHPISTHIGMYHGRPDPVQMDVGEITTDTGNAATLHLGSDYAMRKDLLLKSSDPRAWDLLLQLIYADRLNRRS